MTNYKPGDRVLCKDVNGIEFYGTVEENSRKWVLRDITWGGYGTETIVRKLEGLEAAQVGDIIVDQDDDVRAKILEIGISHTAFLRSTSSDHTEAFEWLTFVEAKKEGWELLTKQTEFVEVTKQEVADKLGIDLDKLKING